MELALLQQISVGMYHLNVLPVLLVLLFSVTTTAFTVDQLLEDIIGTSIQGVFGAF